MNTYHGSKVKRALSERGCTGDRQGVWDQESHGYTAPGKDCREHGYGRSDRKRKDPGHGSGRAKGHRWSEAGDYQGEEVDRIIQAAPGHAYRRDGDAARRPHVRIHGPVGVGRFAACKRFSWRIAEGV